MEEGVVLETFGDIYHVFIMKFNHFSDKNLTKNERVVNREQFFTKKEVNR